MKQINRMLRWFDRHDIEATKRKMIEWKIDEYELFFLKVFETPLNEQEKNVLYFYLDKYKMELMSEQGVKKLKGVVKNNPINLLGYIQYSMDKDTLIAASNILTPVSVGIAVTNPTMFLTIISISTSIILNSVLIYKNLKDKKQKNIDN